jgi:hypothetical protein
MDEIRTVRVINHERAAHARALEYQREQLAESFMNSKYYIGLDTRATLGTVIVQSSAAEASPWQNTAVEQIAQTVDHLRADRPVASPDAIDRATQLTSHGLSSRPYAPAAAATLKQLYYLGPDAPAQAHVVGNLLTKNALPVLDDILVIEKDDKRNYLGTQLGPTGVERLMAIGAMDAPMRQNTELFQMAQDVLMPRSVLRSRAADDARQQNTGGDNRDHLNKNLIDALRKRDQARIGEILATSQNLPALSQQLAAFDHTLATPLDELVMADDRRVSDFAIQTRDAIKTHRDILKAPTHDWTKLDANALKDLLLVPENQPASLASRYGPTRRIQPLILETIAIFGHK